MSNPEVVAVIEFFMCEERDADEVLSVGGSLVSVAGTRVRNPAFDVTPAELVWGLVTERGVARPVTVESIASVA